MTPRRGALALIGLAACRFGGPSADPNEYVASAVDGSSKDGQGPGGDDATLTSTTDGSDEPGLAPDARVLEGGPAGGDASNDGGSTLGVIDGDTDAASCQQTGVTCNPVRNTGCNPFQQCDVDTSQTKTPTGICVFNNGSDGGTSCSSSVLAESCPPQSTCVSGGCRTLCFCGADCPVGECCSDTSGPAGFTLCRPCP